MKPFRCTSAVRQNRLDRMVDGTTSVIVTLRLLSCSRTSAAVAKATVSAKRPRVIGAGLMRALSLRPSPRIDYYGHLKRMIKVSSVTELGLIIRAWSLFLSTFRAETCRDGDLAFASRANL